MDLYINLLPVIALSSTILLQSFFIAYLVKRFGKDQKDTKTIFTYSASILLIGGLITASSLLLSHFLSSADISRSADYGISVVGAITSFVFALGMIANRFDLGSGKAFLILIGSSVLTLLVFFIVLFPVRIFLGFVVVSDNSMLPAYDKNTSVVVDKRVYNLEFNDVVAVKVNDQILVRRIVGLPGQTMEIKENALFANGEYVAMAYPTYLKCTKAEELPQSTLYDYENTSFIQALYATYSDVYTTFDKPDCTKPVTLGPGEYYLLADDRDLGIDSRHFGPVIAGTSMGGLFSSQMLGRVIDDASPGFIAKLPWQFYEE